VSVHRNEFEQAHNDIVRADELMRQSGEESVRDMWHIAVKELKEREAGHYAREKKMYSRIFE